MRCSPPVRMSRSGIGNAGGIQMVGDDQLGRDVSGGDFALSTLRGNGLHSARVIS